MCSVCIHIVVVLNDKLKCQPQENIYPNKIVRWDLSPVRLAWPDILHMYILKSVGHCTLALFIVNFSCALLGESKFPVAEARSCKVESVHSTNGVCPVVTDTKGSNVILEFSNSCMTNTELSIEGFVMEHTITKSFSL